MAIRIDTDMFIAAIEDHNYEIHHYQDTKSGEIVFITEFDMPKEDELIESIEDEP